MGDVGRVTRPELAPGIKAFKGMYEHLAAGFLFGGRYG